MIVTCPECSTRYQVDPGALGGGRRVRCARCGHSWVQEPEGDARPAAGFPEGTPGTADIVHEADEAMEELEDTPSVPPPGGEPPPRPSAPAPFAAEPLSPRVRAAGGRAARRGREPGRRLATALWIVLVLVVAGVTGLVIGMRDMVMATWPAAEAVYDLVGLGPEPPGSGLGLRGVRWRAASQDGESVLWIEGEITNQTDTVLTVPRLMGVIYDAEERELQRWSFVSPEPRLLPGEIVSFETELRNPAAGAARLNIAFEPRRRR